MRRTKRVERAIEFGRWTVLVRDRMMLCGDKPYAAPFLATRVAKLCEDSFRWHERDCSANQNPLQRKRGERLLAELDAVCATLGWEVRWPGLWPSFHDAGESDGADGVRPAELP